MLGIVLLAILAIGILATLPAWPYSRGWGYLPSGAVGVVMLIITLWVVFARL